MKLKEIPISHYLSIMLDRMSLQELKEPLDTIPVLVSLTTIPSRLNLVHLTIRSILAQHKKPYKIILWVHKSLQGSIPERLKKLEGGIFEICFTSLDCAHMKLVPTLKKHPDATIVTADDDLMYNRHWLEKLYAEHLKNPSCIIANQTRIISYNSRKELLPYKQWPTNYDSKIKTARILPIGSAGALYPKCSLSEIVLDVSLFTKLAPKADDLWFKAMSLLNGTISLQAQELPKSPVPILGSQKVSLKKQNIGMDYNREQWVAISDYFDINLEE